MRQTQTPVKIGVLIPKPLRAQLFLPTDQRRLDALGKVIWNETDTNLTVDAAAGMLAECRVGVGSWGTPHPAPALLDACPHLELWEHVAGTVKHMFGPHLDGRALTIASCKPSLADVVAEMTLGEIVLGLRGAFANAAENRRGVAAKPVRSRVLLGATVGIVGASLIGRRVVKLLQPFGCTVLVFDPFLSADEADAMGVERVSDLAELCARCDVVSLHTPDIPACRHLMGAREFAAMRDDAVFINTSRGACVDEAALIAELSQGRLFAILDVTLPEPPAPDSPFRTLPNVVYTWHIAGPPCFNLGRQAVSDIAAFLSGGQPEYVVTENMLETTA